MMVSAVKTNTLASSNQLRGILYQSDEWSCKSTQILKGLFEEK